MQLKGEGDTGCGICWGREECLLVSWPVRGAAHFWRLSGRSWLGGGPDGVLVEDKLEVLLAGPSATQSRAEVRTGGAVGGTGGRVLGTQRVDQPENRTVRTESLPPGRAGAAP